jgi:hypothetical protein
LGRGMVADPPIGVFSVRYRRNPDLWAAPPNAGGNAKTAIGLTLQQWAIQGSNL